MRKLAILTFVTLDGVMQGPKLPEEDTSNAFKKGGWAAPYWDEVMEQVGREVMSEPYDLLLGRKTYELFNEHNATSDSPLNAMTKYVVTNSESKLDWENTIIVSGSIEKEVDKLKNEQGNLLQVHGSWELIQMLLSNNLIDELRLWVFPVMVGTGKRLFQESIPNNFTLLKSKATTNGVVMSIYQRK